MAVTPVKYPMLPGPCTCTGTWRSVLVPSPSLPHGPVVKGIGSQSLMPQVQTVPSDLSAIDSRAPPQTEMTRAGEAAVAGWTAPPGAQSAALGAGALHTARLVLAARTAAGGLRAAARSNRGRAIDQRRDGMRPHVRRNWPWR